MKKKGGKTKTAKISQNKAENVNKENKQSHLCPPLDLSDCPEKVSKKDAGYMLKYFIHLPIDWKFQYKNNILEMQKEISQLKAAKDKNSDSLQAKTVAFLDNEALAFLNSLSIGEKADNSFVNKMLPLVYGDDELKKRDRKKTVQFVLGSPQYKLMKGRIYMVFSIFIFLSKSFLR